MSPLLLALLVAAVPADDEVVSETFVDGAVTVTRQTAPELRQEFAITVPASREQVWHAIATEEGLDAVMAGTPLRANIELRAGGPYEMFDPNGPEGARGMEGTVVLAWIPFEMIAGTGSAPPQFPLVKEEGTRWIYTIEDAGEAGSRLTMTLVEWGEGEEWEECFRYFVVNNARWMAFLHQRLSAADLAAPPEREPAGEGEVDRYARVDRDLEVAAAPGDVWAAFTSVDGLTSWMSRGATCELRFGGDYEFLYAPDAPEGARGMVGTRIQSYLPGRMLAHTTFAPAKLPAVAADPPVVVWRFDAGEDGSTRVRFSAAGFGSGPQWETYRGQLEENLDLALDRLQRLFEHGPIDWSSQ